MTKLFKSPEALISMLIACVSALAYVYTTFATVTYVDKKHEEVKEVLVEIKDSVKSIDLRVWQLRDFESTKPGVNKWKPSHE